MKKIFDAYLTTFLHPFKIHDYYWNGIPLPGKELVPFSPLSFNEGLAFSWLIAIVKGFIDVVLLNLAFKGVSFYQWNNSHEFSIFNFDVSFSGYYFFLIQIVVATLIFPLFLLVWATFWKFVLNLIGEFLGVEDFRDKSKVIVTNAMTSNLMSIIPMFGGIAQSISSTIHLYAGLKKSFNLDSRAAMLALSLPVLVISFATLFVFVSFLLLFI